MKLERDALQKHVFPKLRKLCMDNNCRFQAIDLRWGVSEEAGLDQQTMKICLEEIKRSQRVSPKPNFIVLLGDRYGWQPVPYQIPEKEYDEIYQLLEDENDKKLLDEWFRRDDNALRPDKWFRNGEDDLQAVYDLQPRTGKYEDYDTWKEVENHLNSILREAISKIDLKEEDRLKYFASATEQEIVHGALGVEDAEDHVFCFFRNIKDLPDDNRASDFIELDLKGKQDKEKVSQISLLKDKLRNKIPNNIREYEAEWTGEGISQNHLKKLCDDVYNSIARIIEAEIKEIKTIDDLEKEIDDHRVFGEERAKHFIGRTEILEDIDTYLGKRESEPLVIHGVSGSGKTALMAYAAKKAEKDYPNSEVIFWFIGATPSSSDITSLLLSLCQQISDRYGFDKDSVPKEYQELIKELPMRMSLATPQKPLIIFLDALDQLSDFQNAHNLIWLPSYLPENVHILISTLPGKSLDVFKEKFSEEKILELGAMQPDEGDKLLDLWLREASRLLTKKQREEVLNNFSDEGLPLYLKLAFEEAKRWKSYTPSEETVLSEDVIEIIRQMFRRLSLESHHGTILTSKSLGYLAASRYGLSEDEILDVLSLDKNVFHDFIRRSRSEPSEILLNIKEVLNEDESSLKENSKALFRKLQNDQVFCENIFERLQEKHKSIQLPVILWSRLYFDLEPYLTERQVGKVSLLNFYHSHLAETVQQKYLTKEHEKSFHLDIAKYFDSQILNDRKVDELPYQLNKAKSWDRLKNCICNMEIFTELISDKKKYELMEYWIHIKDKYDMVNSYTESLNYCKKFKSDEELSQYYNEVAVFFIMNNYFDAAEVLLNEALNIHEEIYGFYHETTAANISNIARIHMDRCDYDKAESYFRMDLNILEKVLGPEHPGTAQSLNNLGGLLHHKGDYDAAEPFYRRALEIRKKVLGSNNQFTASTINNLGMLLKNKGDYDEAEKMYRMSLNINENVLGPKHPHTALNLNNLAVLCQEKGNYDDSIKFHERALQIRENALGPENTDTAISLNNLATAYYMKGDFKNAEPLYRTALKSLEKSLGNKNDITYNCYRTLGNLLLDNEDYVGAEEIFLKIVEISEKKFGNKNLETADSIRSLSKTLYEQAGNESSAIQKKILYEKSEFLLERALQIYRDENGLEHPDTALAIYNLGMLCYAKGDIDKAKWTFNNALQVFEKVFGPKDHNTIFLRNYIHENFYKRRNY